MTIVEVQRLLERSCLLAGVVREGATGLVVDQEAQEADRILNMAQVGQESMAVAVEAQGREIMALATQGV